MGYGEFGGGGSVQWRVVHGDKNQKCKDRDPDPRPNTGGTFTIYVDGVQIRQVPVDGHSVRVVWSPDTKESSDADLNDKNSKDPHITPAAGR